MPLNDCDICADQLSEQCVFLGCSVKEFSARLGYNVQATELTVTLAEDPCPLPKYCYNECCVRTTLNEPDMGFFGEKRFQRGDGSQYSSILPESVSHTMVRDAINIVGGPVYFKMDSTTTGESFEFAGIVSDWLKSTDQSGISTYQVKILDPRVILQGCQLIIGDYSGRVDQFVNTGAGGTGCPTINLFNIFGFMEQFGTPCPPYTQCYPGVYDFVSDHAGTYLTTCPGLGIDGEVFGTFVGGFGGSYWNESGMTLRAIIDGMNVLMNGGAGTGNIFSPYGKIAYASYIIPASLNNKAAGLIKDDNSGTGCLASKFFYYIDLTDVPVYNDFYYRISGTSISVLDLLNKLSEDFNFDFYVDLLPTKITGSVPCISKFIKIQPIFRNTQPVLGQIATFIENQECVKSKQIGVELRPENSSKFIIGANKVSVYQAVQSGNPDADFTVPANNASTLASIDPYQFPLLSIIRVMAGSNYIDDTIIPYYGLNNSNNVIVPENSGSVYLPTGRLNADLQVIRIIPQTILVAQNEFAAAKLGGFDGWYNYIYTNNTDSYRFAVFLDGVSHPQYIFNTKLAANGKRVIKDFKNPHKKRGGVGNLGLDLTNLRDFQIHQDLQKIFDWVMSYVTDYLGKKFAVRIPFTCANYDTETNRIRIADYPTNEGGWTEMASILGLVNNPTLTLDPLLKFRDENNRIRAFVRFNNGIGLNLSDLNKDDYFIHCVVSGGSSGVGPPSGSGAKVYTDTANGQVYFYDPYLALWLHMDAYNGIYSGFGTPPTTIEAPQGATLPMVYGIYCDLNTGNFYAASAYSNGGPGGLNQVSITWVPLVHYLYVKAQVQEEYVYHDRSHFYAPRVVVEIPQAIRMKVTREAGYGLSGVGISAMPDESWATGIFFKTIDAAAIPIKSSTLQYGPWHNPSVSANCQVVVDESLAPWNYNGYYGMNIAGAITANNGRSNMLFAEVGSITLGRFPFIPIGAEINYVPTSVDVATTRVTTNGVVSGTGSNGVITNYSFPKITYRSPWAGTYGANITDVSVQVNDNGEVNTTYSLRSFTPREYGINKWVVERLKSISTLNRSLTANIRNLSRKKINYYGYEI